MTKDPFIYVPALAGAGLLLTVVGAGSSLDYVRFGYAILPVGGVAMFIARSQRRGIDRADPWSVSITSFAIGAGAALILLSVLGVMQLEKSEGCGGLSAGDFQTAQLLASVALIFGGALLAFAAHKLEQLAAGEPANYSGVAVAILLVLTPYIFFWNLIAAVASSC